MNNLQGCYSISVAVLLLCILIVVIKHAYERYVSKIEPLIIDPEAIMARRKSSVIRRNAISQCTDSNINGSSSIVLLFTVKTKFFTWSFFFRVNCEKHVYHDD